MKQPRETRARPTDSPKVVLLALVPIGAFLTFTLVRRVDLEPLREDDRDERS